MNRVIIDGRECETDNSELSSTDVIYKDDPETVYEIDLSFALELIVNQLENANVDTGPQTPVGDSINIIRKMLESPYEEENEE